MKIDFDPSDPKQVESVLKMLKADKPDLWVKTNQIPIGVPLWDLFDFSLPTKIFLKTNNFSSVVDLARITREKVLSLASNVNERSFHIIDNLESLIGGQLWKTKK